MKPNELTGKVALVTGASDPRLVTLILLAVVGVLYFLLR